MVTQIDDCRFPDRELIDRKREFNQRVLSLKNILRPIHLLKVAFIKERNYEICEMYYYKLKSLSENKRNYREYDIYDSQSDTESDIDEDGVSYDDGELSFSEEEDDEDFKIVFE